MVPKGTDPSSAQFTGVIPGLALFRGYLALTPMGGSAAAD